MARSGRGKGGGRKPPKSKVKSYSKGGRSKAAMESHINKLNKKLKQLKDKQKAPKQPKQQVHREVNINGKTISADGLSKHQFKQLVKQAKEGLKPESVKKIEAIEKVAMTGMATAEAMQVAGDTINGEKARMEANVAKDIILGVANAPADKKQNLIDKGFATIEGFKPLIPKPDSNVVSPNDHSNVAGTIIV